MKYAASAGAAAPPICAHVLISACGGPRRPGGNQREITRAALGSAPASPAPNKKRINNNSRKLSSTIDGSNSYENFQTHPVNAVNADHQSTMRINTRRDPYQSPQYPVVGSKTAYAI